MVGGVCQYFAAAVAFGAADDRLPPKFPDLAAAANLLHTDRVDLTEIKSPIDLSISRSAIYRIIILGVWSRMRLIRYVILSRRVIETVYIYNVYIVTLRVTRE